MVFHLTLLPSSFFDEKPFQYINYFLNSRELEKEWRVIS